MYVNVRNSAGYNYSNLFLFIKTIFPKGEQTIDTLECTLADPSGKWLGEGLGDIWDNQILFKKNIRFPQSGQYKFEVEQAMRIDPLTSIMDIGLRIEKAEKK
jgi:gliding motility-associated lipoprotein GldH